MKGLKKFILKISFQKASARIFILLLLTDILKWNSYHFGTKTGNYVVISAIFFFSLLLNIIATNKWHTGLKNLWIVFVLALALFIPYFNNINYLSYLLALIAFLSGMLFFDSNPINSLKVSPILLLLASLISLIIPYESLFYLNVLLPISAIGALTYQKIRIPQVLTILLVLLIATISSIKSIGKTYFDDEPRFKGEIIMQKEVNDSLYTLIQTKNDWHLLKSKRPVLSSSDYFMFYESIVHSAMQYHPDAKEILVASPYIYFYLQELNHYPETNVSWINTDSAESALIKRIVRHGHMNEVNPEVLQQKNNRFDLIFVEDDVQKNEFLSMLAEDGLMIERLKQESESKDVNGLTSTPFHIALPTSGEHYWEIYSRDSLQVKATFEKKYAATNWYTSEVLDLIANSGKR